jgi:hypothetical protein
MARVAESANVRPRVKFDSFDSCFLKSRFAFSIDNALPRTGGALAFHEGGIVEVDSPQTRLCTTVCHRRASPIGVPSAKSLDQIVMNLRHAAALALVG